MTSNGFLYVPTLFTSVSDITVTMFDIFSARSRIWWLRFFSQDSEKPSMVQINFKQIQGDRLQVSRQSSPESPSVESCATVSRDHSEQLFLSSSRFMSSCNRSCCAVQLLLPYTLKELQNSTVCALSQRQWLWFSSLRLWLRKQFKTKLGPLS